MYSFDKIEIASDEGSTVDKDVLIYPFQYLLDVVFLLLKLVRPRLESVLHFSNVVTKLSPSFPSISKRQFIGSLIGNFSS